MGIPDDRLNQLANDPMMCNITPEVRGALQELIRARAALEVTYESRHIALIGWLKSRAYECSERAKSRRSYANAGLNMTPEGLRESHLIAEQMLGRKFLKQSAKQEKRSRELENRIADKLDIEAAMLLGFAEHVESLKPR